MTIVMMTKPTDDNVIAPSTGPIFSNNFMLPTVASLSKMVPKSQFPRKPVHQPVWLPPSHSSSKLSTVNKTSLKKSVTSLKSANAAVAGPVTPSVKNNPAPHLVQ